MLTTWVAPGVYVTRIYLLTRLHNALTKWNQRQQVWWKAHQPRFYVEFAHNTRHSSNVHSEHLRGAVIRRSNPPCAPYDSKIYKTLRWPFCRELFTLHSKEIWAIDLHGPRPGLPTRPWDLIMREACTSLELFSQYTLEYHDKATYENVYLRPIAIHSVNRMLLIYINTHTPGSKQCYNSTNLRTEALDMVFTLILRSTTDKKQSKWNTSIFLIAARRPYSGKRVYQVLFNGSSHTLNPLASRTMSCMRHFVGLLVDPTRFGCKADERKHI